MKHLQLDHDNGHDFIGPHHTDGAPKPLTSSWNMHERFAAPPRATQYIFYIDRGNDTVAQAETLEQAYKCIVDLGDKTLTIRPFEITEEVLQADTAFRKWKAQHGY